MNASILSPYNSNQIKICVISLVLNEQGLLAVSVLILTLMSIPETLLCYTVSVYFTAVSSTQRRWSDLGTHTAQPQMLRLVYDVTAEHPLTRSPYNYLNKTNQWCAKILYSYRWPTGVHWNAQFCSKCNFNWIRKTGRTCGVVPPPLKVIVSPN